MFVMHGAESTDDMFFRWGASGNKRQESKARLERKLCLARENPEPIFDVSGCNLRNVPAGIYSLCRVFLKEHLDMSDNRLESLNGGGNVADLHGLKKLSLENNAFTHLPEEIQLLNSLKELYLQNNHIKKLPSSICNLRCLRILNVSNNSLKELPEDIGKLQKLEVLKVSGNKSLTKFPKSICSVPRLSDIEADVENFVYPPPDVVSMGTESIIKFICDDTGQEFHQIPTKDETDAVTRSPALGNYEAKIKELETAKERKVRGFLEMEREREEANRREVEMAGVLKADRRKLLADLVVQQYKLDQTLDKIQQEKDIERFQLIEQLKEVEENAEVAIQHLLEMNREPLMKLIELENAEMERLLAVAAEQSNINLNKQDVLDAMQELLVLETEKFKQFDLDKQEISRGILELESEYDSSLLHLLREQEENSQALASQLLKDSELQKIAMATLLEKSDARSWSLVQQVRLVEGQLAALTLIEMDRRKLEMDQQISDLAQKRISLSMLLVDLLEQQGERRGQLLQTLQSIEESWEGDMEDFWLRQYQQLMFRMPEGISDYQNNMDPMLVEMLLVAGVLNYLPFLAKLLRSEGKLLDVTDVDLKDAGVGIPSDREKILSAFKAFAVQRDYKKQQLVPSEEPTAPQTSFDEASAPPTDTVHSFSTSECVVCLDAKCEIIHVPCGHFCSCAGCSPALAECPMCRAMIERKIRVICS